jgi:hypothetical protein
MLITHCFVLQYIAIFFKWYLIFCFWINAQYKKASSIIEIREKKKPFEKLDLEKKFYDSCYINFFFLKFFFNVPDLHLSGGELLEIRLLDNQLVDTFGRKSTARHKIYQLLELIGPG